MKTLIAIMIVLASAWSACADSFTIGSTDLAATNTKLYVDGGATFTNTAVTPAMTLDVNGNAKFRGAAEIEGPVKIGGWDAFWIWFWSMVTALCSSLAAFAIACARAGKIARREAEDTMADFVILNDTYMKLLGGPK